MVPATNTTTTRRTPSPGRTTFRKRWGGKPSTIRRTAVSSAKSAGGWITGRSCERNVSANEQLQELSQGEHSCRRFRDAGVDASCGRGDCRSGARRAGDEADLCRAGQRAAVLRICGQDCGAEGRGREVRKRHDRRHRVARKGFRGNNQARLDRDTGRQGTRGRGSVQSSLSCFTGTEQRLSWVCRDCASSLQ